MNKILEISSITPARSIQAHVSYQDGFSQELYEAIHATDRKKITFQAPELEAKTQTANNNNNNVEQLVSSLIQIHASPLSNTHHTSGMLGLYIAQERKDEKSGKGRQQSSAYAR